MHTPGHRDPFSPRNLLPRSPSFRFEYNDPIRPPATPKMPGVFPSRKEVDIQNAPIVTGKNMRPRVAPVFRGPDPELTRPVPRTPRQPFPYINSESTQPITMDSLREPDMRGTPIPRAVPPVPLKRSASNEARRAITPELNQTRREARGADRLAGETRSNTLSTPRPEPIARDYFGEQRKNMEDLGMTELQPVAPGMATPQRPQVDESLLIRLPNRSERDRSSMQPGGMGDGSAFDRLRQRDADRVSAANARPMASTQNEVESDSFQHHYGPDVTSDVKAFVNTGRELNSAAGRDYRKQLNQGLDGNLAARKAARLSGETYTDPHTGEMTDYGKFNEYRERLAEGPTLENMSDQRKMRMRRAQLMNYGRTGGVTVAPGGGIAGPMSVGTQATFGPNMSLNQATRMAQGQLDQESRLRQAEQRKQDAERTKTLRLMAEQGDSQAADALRKQVGLNVNPDKEVINREIEDGGITGGVPSMNGRTFSQVPAAERNLMGVQVQSIIKNPNLNDKQREIALRQMYPELTTLAGINALQNDTENFDGSGFGAYLLTEDLMRIMGIESQPSQPVRTRPPANQGMSPSMPVFM